MPNHIKTQVEIVGSKELIAKLVKDTGLNLNVDFSLSEENKFDFNGIVKMPEELLNTTSPTKIFATQDKVDEANGVGSNAEGDTTSAILFSEAERRQAEYGAINWYDWSYANWGTKWNAYEVRLIDFSETKVVIELSTAWGTPSGIWSKLESLGYSVNGVVYGEMDGFVYIGEDPESAFDAYVDVEVEYLNHEQGIEKEATEATS